MIFFSFTKVAELSKSWGRHRLNSQQPGRSVACTASKKWSYQNKRECPKSFRITGIRGCHLDRLNVLSLPALRAFGHVELHRLPFLQAFEAACLNSGEMHENILASLTADKAIAFCVVEPLHCSLFCHLIFLFLFLELCREESLRVRRGDAG